MYYLQPQTLSPPTPFNTIWLYTLCPPPHTHTRITSIHNLHRLVLINTAMVCWNSLSLYTASLFIAANATFLLLIVSASTFYAQTTPTLCLVCPLGLLWGNLPWPCCFYRKQGVVRLFWRCWIFSTTERIYVSVFGTPLYDVVGYWCRNNPPAEPCIAQICILRKLGRCGVSPL